ncbi:MAG: bifunctional folylpolyglutamate synthase/dihydrofolate synthase [Emcibacter sp.]|nr:bifunctional folylpolyglutamate synthase/dihydrofolate synthase [Emcibacter sp.]
MPQGSDKVLERLHRLHPKKIDLSLDRMTHLLAKLDHPERKLPPVIHVAGTNGKGSTVAYLRAILEAAGLRVHVYNSPHLVRFAERIRLAGKFIDEERLLNCLLDCEKINGDTPITYFEITTAIAFLAFAECPADVLLLEVGLGGRLDATNMVDQPLSTVITPVSVDHEQFLGSDLGGIALEKAGIAKKGIPLIIAPQEPEARAAILEHAQTVQARPIDQDHWSVSSTDTGFDYQDAKGALSLPHPSLYGPHQISNAGLAVACLRHQDKFTITADHIAQGITSTTWPARLQDITDSPFGRQLPTGSMLWLDGGHNPAAGQILGDFFAKPDDRPLYLICGMMAGKDTAGFLRPLKPHAAKLYGIDVIGEDSHTADQIAEFARQEMIKSESSPSTEVALQKIASAAQGKAVRVMICGSLYLAGHILAKNDILPQ